MSPADVAGEGHDGVVLRVSGPTAAVWVDGEEREARIVPQIAGGPPVAGDRVELRVREGDEPAVVAIRPRTTMLQRGDGTERRPRVLFANADLLLVVASATTPPLHPRLIDRYLVAGELGNLGSAIIVTKADLPHDEADLGAILDRYRGVGYPTLLGSAKSHELLEQTRALIGGRMAALVGHSGVGKSTLTSGLTGVPRATGAVSAKKGTGRHTTSDPRLIPLPGGGAVVDTAGVRTFHLPRMDRADLEAGFPEIAAAAPGCRFRGCAHDGDAGCAVAAVVSPERLESYRRMLHELP